MPAVLFDKRAGSSFLFNAITVNCFFVWAGYICAWPWICRENNVG